MDFFSILTLVGGLAMFLYGMQVMGDGLEKLSGGKLEKILENLSSNRVKAVLVGAAVTAIIQSSSATTVMVVGFVNSGIMHLSQAVGFIMGANIGTTVTAWILSLAGIESSNFFVRLLNPNSFSPLLALIGVVFIVFLHDEKKKDIGNILVGFAVLMFGMNTMSGAVKPLAEVPEFTNILLKFSNPVLGVLAGALLTAVIQSSSASVGILQALCVTGAVRYGAALPIIMGQNIGTCITAMLSSIGATKNAKRAAIVHLYFNIVGTVTFMVVFYVLNGFLHFSFIEEVAGPAGIAVIHSAFNIIATLVLLPFGDMLVKIGPITIAKQGLWMAFYLVVRLVYLVIGSSVMTFTTTPNQLTDGLEKGFHFLKKVHVPVHEIAMMMSIALRFIPILTEELDKIMKAQMSRGVDFESGNILERGKKLIPVLVPLFIAAIRRASDLAMAMDARCYNGGEGKTRLHPLIYEKRDYIAYGIMLLYVVIMIFCSFILKRFF